MEKIKNLTEYFKDVETTEEYNGYFCSIGRMLTIVILGSICGLRNVSQIQQWASDERIAEFLKEHFSIYTIPSYCWMLSILKIIKAESLNQYFISWVSSMLPKDSKNMTVSLDGKTIRSTGKMEKYNKALHIVSAHLANVGITLGQKAVEGKSNEIPAVQELLKLIDISGCMIVADALNCQKDTAKAIIRGSGDYLLNVKDNQKLLKEDIKDYVQDDDLRKTMDTATSIEKNSGRIERRTAFTSNDINWIENKNEWENLSCIGTINRQVTSKDTTTEQWHYYISSRPLTAEELLKYARLEWTVESMHWLLDVHFDEDFCRVENENVQQNLNIIRKIVLNSIRSHKNNNNSKRPFSKIMLDCLLNPRKILSILEMDKI